MNSAVSMPGTCPVESRLSDVSEDCALHVAVDPGPLDPEVTPGGKSGPLFSLVLLFYENSLHSIRHNQNMVTFGSV